mmetsp:Transcript_26165/g.62428  ORF Transcript_26165/g.62428 Transcript_26165/m.62428 type:complete len:240 (-) Transcript_26165:832-1551(-)
MLWIVFLHDGAHRPERLAVPHRRSGVHLDVGVGVDENRLRLPIVVHVLQRRHILAPDSREAVFPESFLLCYVQVSYQVPVHDGRDAAAVDIEGLALPARDPHRHRFARLRMEVERQRGVVACSKADVAVGQLFHWVVGQHHGSLAHQSLPFGAVRTGCEPLVQPGAVREENRVLALPLDVRARLEPDDEDVPGDGRDVEHDAVRRVAPRRREHVAPEPVHATLPRRLGHAHLLGGHQPW